MAITAYELAERIVDRLKEVAPFRADDLFWQQARAIIATELSLSEAPDCEC